ncbi:helix-turn-helix transcriptional regulator [Pontibacter liquoris]|uniref:helix-turn-helix transcriptional regulator n=1 Tax=Pontibacter liquoris TaxID=2905677 RepID=UPI001FA7265F|nr:helix-turn-helix transcriptional regulator [Pontibacter liquoris]
MIERIRQVMHYKNLSSTQFADEVEVPRAVISHILSGRNKPSLDVMLKIIQTYRDIQLNWLLLGEGDMLTSLAAAKSTQTAGSAPENTVKSLEVEEKLPPPPDKIQESKPADQLPPSNPPGKEVAQIILFYTDKTFSIYNAS